MDKQQLRELIARRVGAELQDGSMVNLGIGLPTLVANYIPENYTVSLQSENGFIGLGGSAPAGQEDRDLIDAGGGWATIIPGAAFFDSASSFAMIRGGHIDVTVLGAFQVDEQGGVASWIIPGGLVSGMGGAMDLVVGAKKVIIAMEHTSKGKKKILKQCTLPLTARNEVDMIVTELAVFHRREGGLVLTELGPEATVEIVRERTEACFDVAPHLGSFR